MAIQKSAEERFFLRKPVLEVLGEDYQPTPEVMAAIAEWFHAYPNSHAEWNWLQQVARWITLGFTDFTARRRKLDTIGRAKHSEETFLIRHGAEGPRLFKEWKGKPSFGTAIDRFLRSAPTRQILGPDFQLNAGAQDALERWFSAYPDARKGRDWFNQLSTWLAMGAHDLLERRARLEEIGQFRNTLETFIIRYGEERGRDEHKNFLAARRDIAPNTVGYWTSRGHNAEEAAGEIRNFQQRASKRSVERRLEGGGGRHFSHRCVEFWMDRGLSETDARAKISESQRRDRAFYIGRYGFDEGTRRHNASIHKRRSSWVHKDRKQHAARTLPKTYRPNGMEAKAIRMFIEQNNLCAMRCVYGPAEKQFYVQIPEVGFRRYDLAVFDSDDKLVLIFEFHGPVHINFSAFDEVLRDELVWDHRGKILPYGVTFGEVYDTDRTKRSFISSHYPDALYIVGWVDDFKKKDFRIGTLLRRYADRVSDPVLQP
jgi:hypothetical protein